MNLRSSAMLRSVDWYLLTDVSGQPISRIFKVQTLEDGCPKTSATTNLRSVTSQKSKYLLVLMIKICLLHNIC
jgi:hypothetical protein